MVVFALILSVSIFPIFFLNCDFSLLPTPSRFSYLSKFSAVSDFDIFNIGLDSDFFCSGGFLISIRLIGFTGMFFDKSFNILILDPFRMTGNIGTSSLSTVGRGIMLLCAESALLVILRRRGPESRIGLSSE